MNKLRKIEQFITKTINKEFEYLSEDGYLFSINMCISGSSVDWINIECDDSAMTIFDLSSEEYYHINGLVDKEIKKIINNWDKLFK